jgi:predicted nucleotide-binding protein
MKSAEAVMLANASAPIASLHTRSRVFIVHGRNESAKRSLQQCLRHWGLEVVDFAAVSAELGGTPFVGQVLRAALGSVQAVIVLLTPDEYSTLDLGFFFPADKPHERMRWQPRPNVIFEAGMAMALDEQRTLLVAIGAKQGLFSDLSGRHVLELDDSPDSMRTLGKKLESAGCALATPELPNVRFQIQVRKRSRSLVSHWLQRAGATLFFVAAALTLTIVVGSLLNETGIRLRRNIALVGLSDINSRANKETDLPPEDIFTHARQEILVFGISAYRTFDQHMQLIKDALNNHRRVLVLLLRPDSKAVNDLSKRDGKRVQEDILSTIYRIKEAHLTSLPNFQVRFYDFTPHYTGIATDSAIADFTALQPGQARVRVQTMSFYKNENHDGIIVQLDDTRSDADGFHFFAHDLRKIWARAEARPELFDD